MFDRDNAPSLTRLPNGDLDPIHQQEGKWFFWDETWAYRHGPYDTREIAQEMCNRYGKEVLGT